MRKKVARKLQKVASCNGIGRATCNFWEFPGAFTYDTPLLHPCNFRFQKLPQSCRPNQFRCSELQGFLQPRFSPC